MAFEGVAWCQFSNPSVAPSPPATSTGTHDGIPRHNGKQTGVNVKRSRIRSHDSSGISSRIEGGFAIGGPSNTPGDVRRTSVTPSFRLQILIRPARLIPGDDDRRVVLPLQMAGVPDLLFQALAVVVVVGVVVLVGRFVLSIAWRLVTIAAGIIAVLLGAMLFLPGLL